MSTIIVAYAGSLYSLSSYFILVFKCDYETGSFIKYDIPNTFTLVSIPPRYLIFSNYLCILDYTYVNIFQIDMINNQLLWLNSIYGASV